MTTIDTYTSPPKLQQRWQPQKTAASVCRRRQSTQPGTRLALRQTPAVVWSVVWRNQHSSIRHYEMSDRAAPGLPDRMTFSNVPSVQSRKATREKRFSLPRPGKKWPVFAIVTSPWLTNSKRSQGNDQFKLGGSLLYLLPRAMRDWRRFFCLTLGCDRASFFPLVSLFLFSFPILIAYFLSCSCPFFSTYPSSWMIAV